MGGGPELGSERPRRAPSGGSVSVVLLFWETSRLSGPELLMDRVQTDAFLVPEEGQQVLTRPGVWLEQRGGPEQAGQRPEGQCYSFEARRTLAWPLSSREAARGGMVHKQ